MNTIYSPYDAATSHIKKFIFAKSSTVTEIIPIVLMFAVFWYVAFYFLKRAIKRVVHNAPWLVAAIERDYERSGKKTLADLQIDMTKEEAIAWQMNDWPRLQCIFLQHLVGSLFCIPSLLGVGDPYVTSSLACMGVLSELGWEVQDLAEILFIRTFFKNGKQMWPNALVLVFVVHHSLCMGLGVPMILFYRTNKTLHWLCFDLQFAAFLGLSIGEYTKILNVKDPIQLRRFKVANFIALVVMTWTRVFHWTYLCFQLFHIWYKDEAWMFLFVGAILSLGFTAFSVLVCVMPFYTRFKKFLRVSAEYEAVEKDIGASVEVRRASVANLEQAVADLLEENETKEITFIESIFVTRQVSRRHTVSISGVKAAPQSSVGGRKRHSLYMAKELADKLKSM